MTHFLAIFGCGFASVFLLGFQSRSVNHGNFAMAAGCSFSIAISQGMLWSRIVAPGAGLAEYATYGLSGSCAITAAMWFHRRFFMKGR
jgi:hypothetical protein